MELLFNLVWFAVSLAIVGAWLHFGRFDHSRRWWTSSVAVMLLVVLLLPAISMTDDLMAASSPAEAEHILQQDVLLSDVPGGTSLDPVATLALLSASVRVLSRERRGLQLQSNAAVLREGFGRVAGVRPPPARQLASA